MATGSPCDAFATKSRILIHSGRHLEITVHHCQVRQVVDQMGDLYDERTRTIVCKLDADLGAGFRSEINSQKPLKIWTAA